MRIRFLNRGHSAHKKAFTFAELLVGLSITSVILAAVATFAYAMMAADISSNDTSQKQAQLRYSTMKVSEIIRYCYLVCGNTDDNLVIWTDDADADRRIGIAELVVIEIRTSEPPNLSLKHYSDVGNESKRFTITEFFDGTAQTWLEANCTRTVEKIVKDTSNVSFVLDAAAPNTRSVGIMFDTTENGVTKTYQTNTALRSWASDLITENM